MQVVDGHFINSSIEYIHHKIRPKGVLCRDRHRPAPLLFDVRTVGLHFGNFLTFTAVSRVLRSTAFIALGTSAIDLAVCLAYAHKGITAYGAYENDRLVATIVFFFLLFKIKDIIQYFKIKNNFLLNI